MKQSLAFGNSRIVVSMLTLVFLTTSVAAEAAKMEGFIKARDGETMILQASASPDVVVLLTDDTNVGQVQGVLKARRKHMSMAALIPGLAVKVEGAYNDQHQLVASSVSFKGNDLQRATSIEAGMHESKQQANQHKAALELHKAQLDQHNAALSEHQKQIDANKANVEAAVARFGQLDDYYIMDEVTVHFANGKTKVEPQYATQVLTLAGKAKSVNGYMIEVKGYASAVGSTALNQKLSEDRAGEVTTILIQQGHVPLTRMLAPGAMGESEQIGTNSTEHEQSANRRVVVRVLQNKAIAGL